jgi:hypothetical protein
MPYKIAGIDVHKNAARSCLRRPSRWGVLVHAPRFWQLARGAALTGGVAGRAAGRGSGDGIDRTVLETRLGNTGAVLETDLPDAGRGILRWRCRAAGDAGARRISAMPNVW